jgi:hypothetical protein
MARPRHFDLIIDGVTVATRSSENRTYSHCVAVKYGNGNWSIASACSSYDLALGRVTEVARGTSGARIEIFPLVLRAEKPEPTPERTLAARKAVLTKKAEGWLKSAGWSETKHARVLADRDFQITRAMQYTRYDVQTRTHIPYSREEAVKHVDDMLAGFLREARQARERAEAAQAQRAALG